MDMDDELQQERDINASLTKRLGIALEYIRFLEAELEIHKQQAIYATWGRKDKK